MILEKQRYAESTPGILEPRHQEEIFALFENSASKPPVSHPLFVKVRPYIKTLQQNIDTRRGAPNSKYYEAHCPSRTISAILKNKCIIHQEYVLPKGFDYYWFNVFCWYTSRSETNSLLPVDYTELLGIRNELMQKNDILCSIDPYITPDTILDAVYGCASQFNTEDILFFVSKRYKYGSKKNVVGYEDLMQRRKKYREIMETSFKTIAGRERSMPQKNRSFVPSPQTINKVERHLGLPETIFPELN